MFVLSAPERLATAAADLTGIREAIDGASAAAAAPISGVLAAAEDEVSLAIADVMSLYGNQYQAVAEQATAFQARFDAALLRRPRGGMRTRRRRTHPCLPDSRRPRPSIH